MAFGGRRDGIAAFKRDPSTLAIEPIGPAGTKLGGGTRVAVGPQIEPAYGFAVDAGFVLLLRRWDPEGEVAWWGLVLQDDGGDPSLVDVGLWDMDVRVAQPLGGQRVGLIVAAAAAAKHKQPGRWQTLSVSDDGRLASVAVAVEVDDLVTTTNDTWHKAELSGERGWLVIRAGTRRPQGVFGGVRSAAGKATLLRPTDGLVVNVRNGAGPPRHRRGDRIYEPARRPQLVRMHNGTPVGAAVDLKWRGEWVGVSGMHANSAVVWSGSHFLCPFGNAEGANLLPIDCRPR